jgi:hypothetical protein
MAGRIWESALLVPAGTSSTYLATSFTTRSAWAAVAAAAITAFVTVAVVWIKNCDRLALAKEHRTHAKAGRASIRTHRSGVRGYRKLLGRLTGVGPFWWLCPGGAERRRQAARALLDRSGDLDGMAEVICPELQAWAACDRTSDQPVAKQSPTGHENGHSPAQGSVI